MWVPRHDNALLQSRFQKFAKRTTTNGEILRAMIERKAIASNARQSAANNTGLLEHLHLQLGMTPQPMGKRKAGQTSTDNRYSDRHKPAVLKVEIGTAIGMHRLASDVTGPGPNQKTDQVRHILRGTFAPQRRA